MSLAPDLLDRLAVLLAYPREGFADRVEECAVAVAASCPDAGEELAPFVELARRAPLHELEELYTRTFEINPECCLEVGWQMYGEQYQRGVFLVRMRELVRDVGLLESPELPDHLTHVLPVLARVEDEDAALMATHFVRPAVDRMAKALPAESPYGSVLRVISQVLALLAVPCVEVVS